jgi:isoleucyl-tRNA synthetase
MPDYNSTINLPKTDFPMRAGLPEREPVMLKEWQSENVYGELLRKNSGKPRYVLHDGPPFSNGSIHMGTALNKVLKDFINRYKSMSGYYTPYKPGWDNHGMPIESAIIKSYGLDRKSMSIPEFRDHCREFAEKYVSIQREQFIRLGVMGDWENPYLTTDPSFEAEEVRVFGEMYRKGYIYKGLKPVYWCPHDETALAEAEIEYQDDPVESIYVKFPVVDDLGKFSGVCDPEKLYFVIWTTTTWSLPGNLAIALNPSEEYVIDRVPSGEAYIIARALVEKTMAVAGISDYEIVHSFTGEEIEGAKARHPFIERESLICMADYVTMDSGTGCVHTAPAHGEEDFITGRKYKLEDIVPIDDKGNMTDVAGIFGGLFYEEASDAILAHLKETGMLFASEKLVHSYPHCWRCKEPIITRATSQWFCSVEAFKDAAVDACEKVRWMPDWGKDRIISMIRERADWCISRQRHWGLPIPVFYCEDCGKPVCTPETIEAVAGLFEKMGSNVWYEKSPQEILPAGFACPHCGGKSFTKETDTLDGWFDSGSSHFASLAKQEDAAWPADMYLEGADQYRGWFQSSMLTSVAVKGDAPYKAVLTHGWVVDGEGKAMHKSLGNVISPEEIIDEYGADLLRLWVASSDYTADVRVSDAIFKQLSQIYLKIRNTARYILGNLDGYDPDDPVPYEELTELDRWALMKLDRLIEKVIEAYENFEYHIIFHAIHNFCVIDMSNFYLDVIKDRLYCEGKGNPLHRSAQTTIFIILDAMVRMLAPILVFTADEIWKAMPHPAGDDPRHVMFNSMAKPVPQYRFAPADMEKWDMIMLLRDGVNRALEAARAEKKIGKPLEAKVILNCTGKALDFVRSVEPQLPTLFIVSQVHVLEGTEGDPCEGFEGVFAVVEKAEGEKCPRCWNFSLHVGKDHEHPELCERCARVVKEYYPGI